MTLIAILVAMALLVAAAVWRWSRPASAEPRSLRTARPADRFAAVEIRSRSGGCAAAHALEGQRFLANKSPALPLTGCTQTRCDCRFVKLSDRRADDRRFAEGGLGATLFSKLERRVRAGRRDAD
jgi:hypothetical protein